MAGMTKLGMPLIGLADGSIQIGGYVFDADDADAIAVFIEDSKKLRKAANADNTRPRKSAKNADSA